MDRRYDIEKATDAACQYLKEGYERFGSWTASAASYNCGMGGYHGQVTYQGTNNYYDLYLSDETSRYIFRILAFKYLLENTEKLRFQMENAEKYQPIPYKEVTVNSTIASLAEFAKEKGTNYRILRLLNPWLRGRSLTVAGGKSYVIRIPSDKSF